MVNVLERKIKITCPCGAIIKTVSVPETWTKTSSGWTVCHNCGKKVKYEHDGFDGTAWYMGDDSRK